eukprot:2145796-Rhodomonas_salina.3
MEWGMCYLRTDSHRVYFRSSTLAGTPYAPTSSPFPSPLSLSVALSFTVPAGSAAVCVSTAHRTAGVQQLQPDPVANAAHELCLAVELEGHAHLSDRGPLVAAEAGQRQAWRGAGVEG